MNSHVKQTQIIEVGPRDGLQNLNHRLSVIQKVDLITRLSETGLKEIEVGAFVSPKWVPQMADTAQVIAELQKNKVAGTFWALVPNLIGYQSFMASGLTHVAVFTAVSETFNIKNTNSTSKESLKRCRDTIQSAQQEKMKTRAYVSTAFYCPYEGRVDVNQALQHCEELLATGVDEISIGDTIGKATPQDVEDFLTRFIDKFGSVDVIALHAHDTYGQAIENVLKAYDMGVRRFDSSIGGLGGCPYAPGAKGNVATEAVVKKLLARDQTIAIDLKKLDNLAQEVRQQYSGSAQGMDVE